MFQTYCSYYNSERMGAAASCPEKTDIETDIERKLKDIVQDIIECLDTPADWEEYNVHTAIQHLLDEFNENVNDLLQELGVVWPEKIRTFRDLLEVRISASKSMDDLVKGDPIKDYVNQVRDMLTLMT